MDERGTGGASRAALLAVIAAHEATITQQQERIAQQDATITALLARVAELEAATERLGVLEEALQRTQAQLRQPKVKPNRPERSGERPPRKRRAQGASRPRMPAETVTEVVQHVPGACARCGTTLSGGWVQRTREVLEVVPQPVQVIRHEIVVQLCPVCQQRCVPQVDLSQVVLGQHRIGLETMALIASLRSVGRLPIRTIQWYLATFHGLHLSVGGIVGVLQAVAQHGEGAVTRLREQVRASPVVCADETSWREDGQNGWCWTFSTPTVRYVEYQPTRGKVVVEAMLADTFAGVLVSDCYAAYGTYPGLHARCWAHLLRDIDALVVQHPTDPAVQQWAWRLVALFRLARRWLERHPDASPAQRLAAADAFTQRLHRLCARHVAADVPHHSLCARLARTEADWFLFVADPAVPTTNNLAERSLRPQVIARKVSGGTRSCLGSTTHFRLASLFGTWQAQGQSAYAECLALLKSPPD